MSHGIIWYYDKCNSPKWTTWEVRGLPNIPAARWDTTRRSTIRGFETIHSHLQGQSFMKTHLTSRFGTFFNGNSNTLGLLTTLFLYRPKSPRSAHFLSPTFRSECTGLHTVSNSSVLECSNLIASVVHQICLVLNENPGCRFISILLYFID